MYKHLNQLIAALVFVATALLLSGQAFADHGRRPSSVIAKTIYKEIYRPIINHRIKHNDWRHHRSYRGDHRGGNRHRYGRGHGHGYGHDRQQRYVHWLDYRHHVPKHFHRSPRYPDYHRAEPKRHRSGVGYRNSNNGLEFVVRYHTGR